MLRDPLRSLIRRLRRSPFVADTGFSVMEMLLVFTVVGIAMIPLATIQYRSRTAVSQADRMSLATELAVSHLEGIKLDGFEAAVPETLENDDYLIITTVTPDTLNPFLRELMVRVVWDAADGERDVTLAAMQSAAR